MEAPDHFFTLCLQGTKHFFFRVSRRHFRFRGCLQDSRPFRLITKLDGIRVRLYSIWTMFHYLWELCIRVCGISFHLTQLINDQEYVLIGKTFYMCTKCYTTDSWNILFCHRFLKAETRPGKLSVH